MKYIILIICLVIPVLIGLNYDGNNIVINFAVADSLGNLDRTGASDARAIEDDLRGAEFTMGAGNETADSICFYLFHGDKYAGDVHYAIYQSDSTFIDSTKHITIGGEAGPDTAVYCEKCQLEATLVASTDYFIVANADAGAGYCQVLVITDATRDDWYTNGLGWGFPAWGDPMTRQDLYTGHRYPSCVKFAAGGEEPTGDPLIARRKKLKGR